MDDKIRRTHLAFRTDSRHSTLGFAEARDQISPHPSTELRMLPLCLARLAVACVVLMALATGLHADVLSERIDSLLANKNLSHGLQGVVVKSLTTGKVLYERNADLNMVPASNMKLLVSATALDTLGPDFTCKTPVYAAGKIGPDGVLQGDLVIRGAGDPVMESPDLVDLAKQVKAKGISKVTGGVIVDDSMFDARRIGYAWSWDYLSDYYAAQSSPLNLDRNVVQVWVRPAKTVGEPAVVTTIPAAAYMTIESTATTGDAKSAKSLNIWRRLGHGTIVVTGSVALESNPTRFDGLITVDNPAPWVGAVFKDALIAQGVAVDGAVSSGKLPEGAVQVAEHVSPPISRIVSLLNKPSDNLVAEVLLKLVGATVKGRGSIDSGAEVEREFFKRVGMDLDAIVIADGSGLSRINYVSPRNLAALLTYMYGHKSGKAYIDSLPIAGVDGTLRNRMKGTAAQGKVCAKTGHIARVSSLSGYVDTKSGETLVFSIMMNHHSCTNSTADGVANSICVALAEME